jgi:hypothetical protein
VSAAFSMGDAAPTNRPVKVLPKTSSSGGTIFFGVIVLVMESFEASRPGNFDSVSSSACKVFRLRHDALANDLQSNECDRVRDVSGACEWRRNCGISIICCKASINTKKGTTSKTTCKFLYKTGVFRPLILEAPNWSYKISATSASDLSESLGHNSKSTSRASPGPIHFSLPP